MSDMIADCYDVYVGEFYEKLRAVNMFHEEMKQFYVQEKTCTNDSLKSDQFVCSVCTAHFDIARLDVSVDEDTGIPNYCPHCGAKVVSE